MIVHLTHYACSSKQTGKHHQLLNQYFRYYQVHSLLLFYFCFISNLHYACLLKDCHIQVCCLVFEELAKVHMELTICSLLICFHCGVEASKLFGDRNLNKGLPLIHHQCLLNVRRKLTKMLSQLSATRSPTRLLEAGFRAGSDSWGNTNWNCGLATEWRLDSEIVFNMVASGQSILIV
jgi:hypothetical protein